MKEFIMSTRLITIHSTTPKKPENINKKKSHSKFSFHGGTDVPGKSFYPIKPNVLFITNDIYHALLEEGLIL